MSHTIVNLSNRPVSIRLNTGATRHIAPRASLAGIVSGEINDNARIDKLARQRVIAVHEVGAGPRSADLSASDAVDHIRRTPAEELAGFLSDGEDRVTVLRAFEEKQRS